MDDTDERFAYRCLPLNIANTHGWLVLNRAPFRAEWNGGPDADGVVVRPINDDADLIASSHFGAGVLTIKVEGLFRTEPGYDLMVTGPFNQTKDAIQPLTGIVETDWAPFTFTMNWKFTRTATPVTFERDEPFCMIMPVKRGIIEAVQPEFREFESAPELLTAYVAWADSRNEHNLASAAQCPAENAENWQQDYFNGTSSLGKAPEDHRTRLRPAPFIPYKD